MQELYWNKNLNIKQKPQEPFSQLQIPSHVPFYVRLNGRRFQAVSEALKAEKPFDEKFTKCIVACGKAIFQSNLAPTLVFVASYEVNALFAYSAPFNSRVEKINSVLASTASSAFSLSASKYFNKFLIVAIDSRIVITTRERLWEYLAWRQIDAWRNHNNAYAYWLLRRLGHRPSEAAKKLKGLKTRDLHELLFHHGINLAKTPIWQRRGILIYREPFQKRVRTQTITRWRIKESWDLPPFSTEEGEALIQQVVEWAKPENRGTVVPLTT
ncbi:MAG: tRNA(His) guanylyltransferase Thg1 family protein [Candidatus Bathyarchaeia archaeon]